MSGEAVGLYKKDGVLYFRRPRPEETGFEPLSMEECNAVYAAMKQAHDNNLAGMNSSGLLDFDGDNVRVKQAAQAALTAFTAGSSGTSEVHQDDLS